MTGLEDQYLNRDSFHGDNPERVTYTDCRIKVPPMFFVMPSAFSKESREVMLTKSSIWSYEREFRIVMPPKHCEKHANASGTLLFLHGVAPTETREIIIGLPAAESTEQLRETADQANLNHLKILKAKIASTEFKRELESV